MKFRKKPVVIEAVQLRWNNWNEMCDFAGVGKNGGKTRGVNSLDGGMAMELETLEGVMLASENDWIIRGVKGEFYPCKPDIFEATYEPVVEDKTEGSNAIQIQSPARFSICQKTQSC